MGTPFTSEIPTPITLDVWIEYAKNGKAEELDEAMINQFGLIEPEGTSSLASPIENINNFRDFLINKYKFGEDKLLDIYVLRRTAVGFAEAKKKFDQTNKDFTESFNFDKSFGGGFALLLDKYVGRYWEDSTDPEVLVSIFEPIMKVTKKEDISKTVNTYLPNDLDKIMEAFEKRGNKDNSM